LKKSQWIAGILALAALVALFVWGRARFHFSFHIFAAQMALADWSKIAIAVACIYIAYVFRSARWSLLMRHQKRVGLFFLVGTQVIGFTAVALIGRVADPVRPYLVARKTGIPLSEQFAVYIVERLFDFGSMALIICTAILLAPNAELPHPEILKRAGYGGLALTLAGVLFLVVLRLTGGVAASILERGFGVVSKKLGAAVGSKVRAFRSGLDTIRSLSDFGIAATLSLVMWTIITLAYLDVMRAFTASPQLAGTTLVNCILLLAVSGGVSVLQLPVLGWFSQIAFVAAALSGFFHAAPEAATACAALLLLVTFLSIVPVGLIWAHFEHVSLRRVTTESENVEENLEASAAVDPTAP
jgi:glycosyltransferase 2 family protein